MDVIDSEIKINKFPVYKNSGISWLGEIPGHWEIVRSRRLFRERKERARATDEQLTASQKYGIISQREFMELEGRKVTQVEFNREILKHIEANDFVISMRSFQGGIEYSNSSGCVSSAYIPLIPIKNVVPGFFKYLFKSDSYIKALSSTSNLVRDGQAMRFENFTQVDLMIVPEVEQTTIANFLNKKTAEIDQAIAQKERLIELLKERRQILIHKAVTRGLNPDVKMKDSGVEWIGEVPEHWAVKRIKTITRVKRGASPRPIDDPRYFNENGEFSWVRIADVSANEHYLLYTEQKLSRLGASLSVKIYEDELFISIAGTVGKPMIAKIKCCIHDGFVYFPDLKSPREFLYRIFETGQPYLGLGKHGTQLNLNTETIGNIRIPFPPEEEQKKIVAHVERNMTVFSKSFAQLELQIKKLKEYKAALINSAVTGKIKVSA